MNLKSEPIVPSRTEPTAYELATLAARLYNAQFQPEWKYQHLSQEDALKDALAWWVNAGELLDKWRADPASIFPPEPPSPFGPEPKSYPVTLDQFLLLMLPRLKGRPGERYGIFREYLPFRLRNPSRPSMLWPNENKDAPDLPPFDCCNPQILPALEKSPYSYSAEARDTGPLCTYVAKPALIEPSKDDVDAYFARWQSTPIPNRDSFNYHREAFLDWFQKHHLTQVSNARRTAGTKGNAGKRKDHSAIGKPDGRKGARPNRVKFQQVLKARLGEVASD